MESSICVGENCELGFRPFPNRAQGSGYGVPFTTKRMDPALSRVEEDDFRPYEKGGAPLISKLKEISGEDSATLAASSSKMKSTHQGKPPSALSR